MIYSINTGALTRYALDHARLTALQAEAGHSLCALLCLVTVSPLIKHGVAALLICGMQYANMPDSFVFIAFYFTLPKRMPHINSWSVVLTAIQCS